LLSLLGTPEGFKWEIFRLWRNGHESVTFIPES